MIWTGEGGVCSGDEGAERGDCGDKGFYEDLLLVHICDVAVLWEFGVQQHEAWTLFVGRL